MSNTLKKLNLKEQRDIVVVNSPPSFDAELHQLNGVTVVHDPRRVDRIDFALAFVSKQAELDALARMLCEKANGDAVLWFAYPKGTSKRYQCEFNRDSGWESVRAAGFDSVRQVAIDEDWTALRFRRIEFIKSSRRT